MLATLTQLDKSHYPSSLLEIPEPPERLWMRGRWAPEGTKYLAVVGSRALTRYGKEACDALIGGLTGYPISIVSGLALGADAAAHRAALKAGLHTLAIPGSGLNDDVISPRSNADLAHDILNAGGMLLSEQEPGEPSRPQYFPSRNRIMVGIADAVLVIEAGDKSGTLITARLASEYNRDLLCVPHRIGDPHGFAAHLFIRLGAALVTDPLHILEALHIAPREGPDTALAGKLEGAEKVMYAVLVDPLPRDEAIRESKLAAGEALTALVALELKGLIREEFGVWRRV
ncbi:MAG TPA: DNA-processing protein DprA [Candidatus Paceibacterota bacterium]|nr:DNA-processing protein DprA [Candidatus Paceibacterota bacterium]